MAAAETIATEKWKTDAVVGHVRTGFLNNFYKSSIEMNRKDFPLVSKRRKANKIGEIKDEIALTLNLVVTQMTTNRNSGVERERNE